MYSTLLVQENFRKEIFTFLSALFSHVRTPLVS